MIKHSSVYHLLTMYPPLINEIYIELHDWERYDQITEMR